jgi:hypothetical protein
VTPRVAWLQSGVAYALSVRLLLALVPSVASPACARPQYTSEQHAALQTPVTLGEGNTGKPPLPDANAAAQSVAPVQPRLARKTAKAKAEPEFDPSAQPDPEPAETLAYYNLTLRHCDGEVHLISAEEIVLDSATTLPSKMGRFAVELWIGRELLERARFDFPLLGAESNERAIHSPALFGPRADVIWTVAVADRKRTTLAWVVDRLTGKRWDVAWPPEKTPGAPNSAGVDAPCPVRSAPAL